MSFTGKTKASTYKDILQIDNSNNGIDATTRIVKDGEGTASALHLSDDQVAITPKDSDGNSILKVTNKAGSSILTVDTTNSLVKANDTSVNTQIKIFGLDSNSASPDTADTWHALVSTYNLSTSNELEMGTGSTPATSLTISNTAYLAIKHYWYVPFNITIDSCNVWAAADAASGDTFKFSVMSYTVDSGNGSTSGDLSSGVENCVSPSTIAGAGREQAYYQALTVSTADVDAGKVIMACVHQDGTNADLTVNMQLVYHIR
tara:strand:- start:12591 stop:13373 length:783 start_codon:yes stop_codon:yes gene_type:complete